VVDIGNRREVRANPVDGDRSTKLVERGVSVADNLATTREERICSFTRLARDMARDVRHWSLDYDDLVQEAMIAAVQAVDGYDPVHGSRTPLNRYVQYHIRCALKKAIRTALRATRNREDADMTKLSFNN
jgi:RNA polymerase sigma factor (sigma-70 family)